MELLCTTHSETLGRHALLVGVTIALIWVATRERNCRAALQQVSFRAALLVPAAMAITTLVLVVLVFQPSPFHENPVGLHGQLDDPFTPLFDHTGPGWPWLMVTIAAILIAGQIGLLEADHAGQRPNGDAFLRGIGRHGLTIFAGKLLIVGGVWLISLILHVDNGPWLVLYTIPSLLLAPLVGCASRNPLRPLRALRDALVFAREHIHSVGIRVIAETGVLGGMLMVYDRALHAGAHPKLLVLSSSTLSYNLFPFALLRDQPLAITFLGITASFVSTVFLTANWRAVMDPIESVAEPHTTAGETAGT